MNNGNISKAENKVYKRRSNFLNNKMTNKVQAPHIQDIKKPEEDERKVVILFKRALDSTKNSLDISATNNRNWLVLLVSLLAAAVTLTVSILDVDLLLRKEAIELPLISVKVPLRAFYYGMPILLLLLHFDVLQNLREHEKKLKQWLLAQQVMRVLKPNQHLNYLHLAHPIDWQILSQYKNLDEAIDYKKEIDDIHNQSFVNGCAAQLFPFLYDAARVNYGENHQPHISQHLTALSAWLMYVAAPVLAMLIFLVRFADLQEISVTLWHTFLLALDLILVYVFWPTLQKKRVSKPVSALSYLAKALVISWFFLVMSAWTGIQILHFSVIATIKQKEEQLKAQKNESWKQIPETRTENLAQTPSVIAWWHISEATQITWRTWLKSALSIDNDSFKNEGEYEDSNTTNAIFEEDTAWSVSTKVIAKAVIPRLVITPIQARLVKVDEDALKLAALYNKTEENTVSSTPELEQHNSQDSKKGFRLHNIDAQTQRKLLQQVPPTFDFSGRRLAFAHLTGVWLPSVPLQNADLQGAVLNKAQLQGADLSNAQLQGADLNKAQLQGANFRQAQLQGVVFREAQLQGADLIEAQLQGANLIGAQLQGANLIAAQLKSADLIGAQLQGAGLIGTQLQDADLFGAELQGAELFKAQLQGAYLISAQLQGANLYGAQLQGADLIEAQLQGANLYGAELQGADLTKAQLQGADLTKAQLQGADLTNAQLQAAVLMDSAWYGAVVDEVDIHQSWRGDKIIWRSFTKDELATIKQLMPKQALQRFSQRLNDASQALPVELNYSGTQRQDYLQSLAKLFCYQGIGHTILKHNKTFFFNLNNKLFLLYLGEVESRITKAEIPIFKELISQESCQNSNTTLVNQQIDEEYAKYKR